MSYRGFTEDEKQSKYKLRELSENWTCFDWREFRRRFYDGDYYAERGKHPHTDWFRDKRMNEMIKYNKAYGK